MHRLNASGGRESHRNGTARRLLHSAHTMSSLPVSQRQTAVMTRNTLLALCNRLGASCCCCRGLVPLGGRGRPAPLSQLLVAGRRTSRQQQACVDSWHGLSDLYAAYQARVSTQTIDASRVACDGARPGAPDDSPAASALLGQTAAVSRAWIIEASANTSKPAPTRRVAAYRVPTDLRRTGRAAAGRRLPPGPARPDPAPVPAPHRSLGSTCGAPQPQQHSAAQPQPQQYSACSHRHTRARTRARTHAHARTHTRTHAHTHARTHTRTHTHNAHHRYACCVWTACDAFAHVRKRAGARAGRRARAASAPRIAGRPLPCARPFSL
jgi:hypothetical protein